MTTLVVSNWHAHPRLMLEQIESYNIAFEGDLIHCININSDHEKAFFEACERSRIDLTTIPNLYMTSRNVKTAWAMVMHAYLSCVLDTIIAKRSFDYIYLHTASDLLIKPDIRNFIRQFEVGFTRSPGTTFTLDHDLRVADIETRPPSFQEGLRQDHRVYDFLRGIRAERVYKARAEGCFFRRDVFFEILFPLMCHMSAADMGSIPSAYPIEEYLLATCVELFCARNKVRRTRNVIVTSKNVKQRASPEEMDEVMASRDCFGIKRFEPSLDDPDREYARRLLRA